MYLRAGLLDALDAKEGQGPLAAIAADPELTSAQKQSLTQIYETFRRENARSAAEPVDASEPTPEAPTATPEMSEKKKPVKRAARSVASKPEETK
jgi:hypothetical protein